MELEKINWSYISKTIEYFTKTLNYVYVDTPWIVSNNIKALTFSGKDIFEFSTMNRTLVGSAEQGFIKKVLDDELLEDTNYISCGPCFRNEEVYDSLHRKYFMKAEMFKFFSDKANTFIYERALSAYTLSAIFNFSILLKEIGMATNPIVIETEEGLDITLNGIEIGSYGIRQINKMGKIIHYVYGTAIAEPRFSEANKIKV